jgi:hypothetical protein
MAFILTILAPEPRKQVTLLARKAMRNLWRHGDALI